MARYMTFAAFGWLTLTGTLHFAVDVVSQYLRGKRVPGPETTLYYGLNSAFALGQVLFGLMCLWSARRHPDLLRDPSVALLAAAGAAAWLALTFTAMEYREPKLNAGVFAALLVIAIVAERARA
jgi:peptidoglycan/LPS O-acetylase OafA/YrhL